MAATSVIKKLAASWRNYKYRFVPWLTFNLRHRTLNVVSEEAPYVGPSQQEVISIMTQLFQAFHDDSSQSIRQNVAGSNDGSFFERNLAIMKIHLGFCIQRAPSTIPGGGTGVLVTDGHVRAGQLVALYPGTVYAPGEPLFFQSIANQFVFKCIDGVHVDGNDRHLSKTIYKSCVHRDQIGPHLVGDLSWLTDRPLNPLAVGQYVNNRSKDTPCNVVYQEFDVPRSFPLHLRRFLPNINFHSSDTMSEVSYHHATPDFWVRVVALVATTDIERGQELFSSYFTVVR